MDLQLENLDVINSLNLKKNHLIPLNLSLLHFKYIYGLTRMLLISWGPGEKGAMKSFTMECVISNDRYH